MRIEDSIKQKKFANEHEKALVNLIYSGNWITGTHNKALKSHGISVQQYNILRILRGQKGNPISVNALINRMLDKMSNASRLVEKLRQKGYVERKVCPEDRRQVDVFITQKGLELLDTANDTILSINKESIQLLSDSEVEQLNFLLDKIRENDKGCQS